jgi:uncharacterized membrane protein YdbT with pleckstrin-like domain
MSKIDSQLNNTEKILYRCRPARRAFIGEYLLFFFVMLLTFTSLYSTLISWVKNNIVVSAITTILFFMLLMISIILLVKVEYKIWSKKYTLTNHKVMCSEGIFTEKFSSTVYGKITDIGLKQTFFDKVMNTGTIGIDTAGTDKTELIFENIARPFKIKDKISELQISTKPVEETEIKPASTHVKHRR